MRATSARHFGVEFLEEARSFDWLLVLSLQFPPIQVSQSVAGRVQEVDGLRPGRFRQAACDPRWENIRLTQKPCLSFVHSKVLTKSGIRDLRFEPLLCPRVFLPRCSVRIGEARPVQVDESDRAGHISIGYIACDSACKMAEVISYSFEYDGVNSNFLW